jgi:acetylglutamate kinase
MRRTDAQTMEIVEMVLAGKINKEIAAQISAHGTRAVGLSGKDAGLLMARKLMPAGRDLGFVGEVTGVNVKLIATLVKGGFVPVISSVGIDAAGQTYKINADYAAVAVAGALRAKKLIFLTDVPGILTDVNDPRSVISEIEAGRIKELLENGRIKGGMIPKVECCMAAADKGVKHVHILDGRVEHALILEMFTEKGIGTMITLKEDDVQ